MGRASQEALLQKGLFLGFLEGGPDPRHARPAFPSAPLFLSPGGIFFLPPRAPFSLRRPLFSPPSPPSPRPPPVTPPSRFGYPPLDARAAPRYNAGSKEDDPWTIKKKAARRPTRSRKPPPSRPPGRRRLRRRTASWRRRSAARGSGGRSSPSGPSPRRQMLRRARSRAGGADAPPGGAFAPFFHPRGAFFSSRAPLFFAPRAPPDPPFFLPAPPRLFPFGPGRAPGGGSAVFDRRVSAHFLIDGKTSRLKGGPLAPRDSRVARFDRRSFKQRVPPPPPAPPPFYAPAGHFFRVSAHFPHIFQAFRPISGPFWANMGPHWERNERPRRPGGSRVTRLPERVFHRNFQLIKRGGRASFGRAGRFPAGGGARVAGALDERGSPPGGSKDAFFAKIPGNDPGIWMDHSPSFFALRAATTALILSAAAAFCSSVMPPASLLLLYDTSFAGHSK